jgi:hypothetical protein
MTFAVFQVLIGELQNRSVEIQSPKNQQEEVFSRLGETPE